MVQLFDSSKRESRGATFVHLTTRFLKGLYWETRSGRGINLSVVALYLAGAIVEICGIRLRLHRELSFEIINAIVNRQYERSERKLIQGVLRHSDVVVELGAGLGYISSVCARLVGSDRVFTYEANPQLEMMIRDTFTLNGVSPQLRICLVGKISGTSPFYIAADFWRSSTIKSEYSKECIEIEIISLQAELDRVRPTVLIVDIEGGEYDIIDENSLKTCRLIMLEVHPEVLGEERAAAVLQRIEQTGFQLRATQERTYLFERTEKK